MQQLKCGDYVQRLNFTHEMQAIFDQNDNLIVISGHQQNCYFWVSKNSKNCTKDRCYRELGALYQDQTISFYLNLAENVRLSLQQDGVTAHTTRVSMDVIRPLFPCLLISRFGDIHC